MTEMLFYHLQGQKLEGVLPGLLEKSLDRGWTVIVQGASEERIEALDAHLWTYRDDGFLPHGTWREAEAAAQPVLLTVNDDNPNGATDNIAGIRNARGNVVGLMPHPEHAVDPDVGPTGGQALLASLLASAMAGTRA